MLNRIMDMLIMAEDGENHHNYHNYNHLQIAEAFLKYDSYQELDIAHKRYQLRRM